MWLKIQAVVWNTPRKKKLSVLQVLKEVVMISRTFLRTKIIWLLVRSIILHHEMSRGVLRATSTLNLPAVKIMTETIPRTITVTKKSYTEKGREVQM